MEESDIRNFLKSICSGLPVDPIPPKCERDPDIAHAPVLNPNLSEDDTIQAVSNALRYFPSETHAELGKEFLQELNDYGHIYMYRFKPNFPIKAYPIDLYPVNTKKSAAIMHMIMNNLDPRVAQFPEELVTYGGKLKKITCFSFVSFKYFLQIFIILQEMVKYSRTGLNFGLL